MSYRLDITAALEQLRTDLRAELLEDLRTELRAELTWPEFMSIETAARYLDLSEDALRKHIQRGHLAVIQEAPGCRVFLARTDINHWMHSMRQPTQEHP